MSEYNHFYHTLPHESTAVRHTLPACLPACMNLPSFAVLVHASALLLFLSLCSCRARLYESADIVHLRSVELHTNDHHTLLKHSIPPLLLDTLCPVIRSTTRPLHALRRLNPSSTAGTGQADDEQADTAHSIPLLAHNHWSQVTLHDTYSPDLDSPPTVLDCVV